MNQENPRALHQILADQLLYFSVDDTSERREVYKNLFSATWKLVPESDQSRIQENLEFILCKPVIDFFNNSTPACALLNRISFRCYIIFDPFYGFLKHQTKIHILAHEFCHVFYKHPFVGYQKQIDSSITEEQKYIEEVAEPEAYALTEKWGIRPDPEDVDKLPNYRKYVLKQK